MPKKNMKKRRITRVILIIFFKTKLTPPAMDCIISSKQVAQVVDQSVFC